MNYEQEIQQLFSRVCEVFKLKNFKLKFLRRQVDANGRGILNIKKSYTLAHTNLKDKIITIDIYTPRFRKPKSIKSILNILAHEIAHHQKPPYRQFYRGKWIVRQHYPGFYKQVKKNINKMKRDKLISKLISSN